MSFTKASFHGHSIDMYSGVQSQSGEQGDEYALSVVEDHAIPAVPYFGSAIEARRVRSLSVDFSRVSASGVTKCLDAHCQAYRRVS